MFVLEKFGAKKLGSKAFITAPGRYRQVEENLRKHSDKFAARNCATLKSYDQKTE